MVVLCATEITNWGALVYAFIVASSTIAATEGWQLTHLLGAFTVAQLVAGLAGVWVGRRIDAVGPRALMTAGSILGAIAMVVVASSTSLPAFYAGWMLAGFAMSAILYAPAFAAITGWAGTDVHHRIRALTAVTLVAGLASTVFAPLTAWLLDAIGWRATYLVMAALVAATAAAHWWGLRKPWPGTHVQIARKDQAPWDEATQPFRAGEFRLLVAAMALGGFCVHAVVVNLVPLLLENGLSLGAAATVMAVGGVGQVAADSSTGVSAPSPVLRLERGSPSGSWPCPRSRSPRSIHRGSSWRSSPSPAAWREACSPLSKPLRSPIAGDRRPTVRATGCSAARRWAPQPLLRGRGRSWQTMSAASPRRSGCWPWAWLSRPQASDQRQAGAFLSWGFCVPCPFG